MASVNPFRVKYGLEFPSEASDLDIELICYRDGSPHYRRDYHFKKAVDLLWNHPDSVKKFVWHPWAEEMAEASIDEQYLAVGGCASSGKTDFFAVEGIIEWLCAPHATQCLFTSTSLKDSRKRIWSTVEDYFQAVPGMPGKLVSSTGVIRFEHDGGQSDKYGLSLVAADATREKEAVGKLIGFKAPRLRLYADELPELAVAILNTAYGNLAQNDDFRMRGLGNPNSHYDAFGRFCEPEDGWKSVNETMYRWRTKRGLFIRFDGEKSPNVLAGKTIYPFLITQEKLDEAAKMGKDSITYYRMIKGMWCPSGADSTIYNESEIENFRGTEEPIWSETKQKVKVASLDPSFTNGGDRCILRFGVTGTDADGISILDQDETLHLSEDVRDPTPRTHQLAKQIKDACERRGIHPKHFAMDVTGAGGPFADVIATMWSNEFLRVYFGGAASDRPVSNSEPDVLGPDRYDNRVSELWFSGKELLRAGQLRGLDASTILEMTNRKYSTRKGGKGLLLKVESKVEMKSRGGISPDLADALFIMVDLCRERLGFSPIEVVPKKLPSPKSRNKSLRRFDVAGSAERYLT